MIKKVLFLGLAVGLSIAISCEQPKKQDSIKWRVRSIKKNKLLYAFNIDSLPVKAGDTVLLNYNSEGVGFYIANVSFSLKDTAYLSSYVDSNGVEQTYHYETVNVVLLDNEIK